MKKEYDLSKLKSRKNRHAFKLNKSVNMRLSEDERMREHALKAEVFDQTNPEEMIELSVTHMDGLDPNETFDGAKLLALCQK
jgi:hypothetical protein